jgi:hypothetical protein
MGDIRGEVRMAHDFKLWRWSRSNGGPILTWSAGAPLHTMFAVPFATSGLVVA